MANTMPAVSSRTIDLDHEQLLVLDDRSGARIQVLHGGVWLTEERSLVDRFGSAGQWLRIEARGRAIAEAIGKTRIRVLDAPRRSAPRRGWRGDSVPARAAAALLALLMSIALPDLLARSMHASAVAAPDQTPALASWSSPTLGTSEGRPTINGSTGPTAARSRRA